MEENFERIQTTLGNEAINKFFRVCYKQVTAQRGVGKFQESDHQLVVNCQHRLAEVMHIVFPTLVTLNEE